MHELAHTILHEMGYYVEVNRDFASNFENKDGTDIQDGRLTMPIVLALQRASPEQKKTLNAYYGCNEPEKVAVVKQVC